MRKRLSIKIIIVFFIILTIVYTIITSFNDHTYVAVVTNKERIVDYKNGERQSYYLIFCNDNNGNYYEFKNEDSFVRLKFNSSTIYNKIEIGETYKFTVVGFRVGIFSWYENIIKFEKSNLVF